MNKSGVNRPFAPACARNQEPILEKLKFILKENDHVFEIGSGTGQHALYITTHLPSIRWTTSDLPNNHCAIQAWIAEQAAQQILGPKEYESRRTKLPVKDENVLFTANTLHIMGPSCVEQLIQDVAQCPSIKTFIAYGPFNYQGQFTSESNQRFDASLKERYPEGGIRDYEWIQALWEKAGFGPVSDFEMPANNRLIVFQRS